jgi:hypothetical protein
MVGRALKKTVPLALLVLVALSLACHRENKTPVGGVSKTETIAPAQAPSAPTGTEAMTQTVDIEDSRSEAEGGVLTNGTSTAAAPATPSTTTAPLKRAPAKKH